MKKEFLVTDYGIIPDSGDMCTAGIQAAIDDCFLQGGGKVTVPAGTFKSGGLRIRSGVTLYLKSGAVLLASRDPEDYFGWRDDKIEPLKEDEITDVLYNHSFHITDKPGYTDTNSQLYDFRRKPGSRWNNAFIRALHANDIAIIGEEGSVIDGANCFDSLNEDHYRGPHGLNFFCCENVTLRGYIFRNSSNFCNKLIYSRNILCENLTVFAGHDGVHFNVCDNVVVRNCILHTGDDSVAGFGISNLLIENCELNTACNAVRLGATNAVIRNCRIYGPGEYLFRGSLTPEEKKNGAPSLNDPNDKAHEYYLRSAFTYYGEYASEIPELPGNILFTDCVIENSRRFVLYDYGRHLYQRSRPLESITFRNIKATGIEIPIVIYGDSEVPVSFTMENASIEVSPEFEHTAPIYACDFKRISLENVTISGHSFEAAADAATDGKFEFDNVKIEGLKENTVRKSEGKSDFVPC